MTPPVSTQCYLGLMSGTSLDGVDGTLVDFSAGGVRLIGTAHLAFPADLKSEALALLTASADELHRTALLGNRLAHLYAETVAAVITHSGRSIEDIVAIGCHGQTLRHQPVHGYTLQANNPALLAELSGIRVIADFRSRDIAAGGQGAPLVPAAHDALFRSASRHRVMVNLGGIANITDLKPGYPTRGFDTGPANMLMDAWARRHLGVDYDADGRWAASGRVQAELLARLMQHPYLALPPPKSCGAEQFHLGWLDSQTGDQYAPADVQATLAAYSVNSIKKALRDWCGLPDELYLCGGGARNPQLAAGLAAALPGVKVGTTDDLGIAAEWVEAVAFAWLARQHCLGLPGNLPAVTGAKGLRILGASYPA